MGEECINLLTENQNQSAGCIEIRNRDDVTEILCLHKQGWGTKRIAKALGISRNTVKKYMKQREWAKYSVPANRTGKLDDLSDWLRERIQRHKGNADVVRQELKKEKGDRGFTQDGATVAA